MIAHLPSTQPSAPHDILVAGAGAVGLAAALALARAGWRVALVGRVDARRTGQTIALLDGSLRFLASLGLGGALEGLGARLKVMRIIDDTGGIFRAPQVEFRAEEIGLEAFGRNVEACDLVAALADALRAHPNCTQFQTDVTAFTFQTGAPRATLAAGAPLAARLIVGADGRKSLARRSAGIAQRDWTYPQAALTAILSHHAPHEGASTEIHTREGPFTLVPLRPVPEAPHRSSLVWMMDPAKAKRRAGLDDGALAGEIEDQCQSMLGEMRCEGPRGLWPISGSLAKAMTAPRLALVGEATHSFPPIGAQGLNLSLRDVKGLTEALGPPGSDPGSAEGLTAYAQGRLADVHLRSFAVDALNRSLLTHFMPLDLARGVGLSALGAIGPLRRAAMRMGLAG